MFDPDHRLLVLTEVLYSAREFLDQPEVLKPVISLLRRMNLDLDRMLLDSKRVLTKETCADKLESVSLMKQTDLVFRIYVPLFTVLTTAEHKDSDLDRIQKSICDFFFQVTDVICKFVPSVEVAGQRFSHAEVLKAFFV